MRIDRRNLALTIASLATVASIAVLVVDVNQRPARPPFRLPPPPTMEPTGPVSRIAVPVPPKARHVYLAPFGEFPRAKAEALVDYYRDRFGLSVEITTPIPLPDGAFDAGRDQVIAERLIEAIEATDLAGTDPEAVIIGLTDADMYIADSTWRYAYGLRSEGTTAIASTARMGALRADEARQMQRLRKIVTKDLGVLYYGLTPSEDPRSVMYWQILGPDDLDAVGEDF